MIANRGLIFQLQQLKWYFKVEMGEVQVFHDLLQHLDLAGVRGSYRLSWTCYEKRLPFYKIHFSLFINHAIFLTHCPVYGFKRGLIQNIMNWIL